MKPPRSIYSPRAAVRPAHRRRQMWGARGGVYGRNNVRCANNNISMHRPRPPTREAPAAERVPWRPPAQAAAEPLSEDFGVAGLKKSKMYFRGLEQVEQLPPSLNGRKNGRKTDRKEETKGERKHKRQTERKQARKLLCLGASSTPGTATTWMGPAAPRSKKGCVQHSRYSNNVGGPGCPALKGGVRPANPVGCPAPDQG